ncbi:MAG: glycosyltransferase family 4 protein, partial [Nocardioidaceae bacterium]|nr:glycosyltransferase family 4 protein [Nocardioidaceae bacterium]
ADAETGRAGPAALRARRAALAASRLGEAVRGGWTEVRSIQTDELREKRAVLDRPLDRWATAAWERALGDEVWRHFDPHLWDYELAFGPEIDRLEPDLVHANDFRMSGVGARAVTRLRGAGRETRLVYDCHEWVPGMSPRTRHGRWIAAQAAYERVFIHAADAVTTVSEPLADLLVEEHGLATRPAVVLNAPVVDPPTGEEAGPTVRDRCGLDDDVPLLVYSGVLAPQRGVGTMVEAMPALPGVHVALVVSSPTSPFALELVARATELGVEDRLHFCPYVAPEHVVRYVSTATVGVHPTTHLPNHEISLATKFFEYAHARIPIVVSDVRTMSEAVRRHEIGEVFVAEDVADYARAVRTVLGDPERYQKAYDDHREMQDEWTWERQADVLDAVYARLVEGR